MKVYNSIESFTGVQNAVVTTGTFDGVHKGHQQIVDRLKKTAQSINGETVLLTFFPHPRLVLFPDDNELKLLNTQEEKIALLKKVGIDHLIVQQFTKEFSRISSLDFVRNILSSQLQTKRLVIGYDHRFGRNREGFFEHLKEFGHMYGFEVEEIPAQEVDEVTVSSTKIRNALIEGDIKKANHFLGYNYMLTGTVIKGNQLGRTIGFPTANIAIEEKYKLIPQNGVYVAKATVENHSLNGMVNIGVRPTVNGKNLTVEINLFDFDGDIYGKKLQIELIDKLRNEIKFENLEQLKEQLVTDKENTIRLLQFNLA